MTSVSDLTARRDSLEKQKDSGIARVTFEGRTVEYRGQSEIERAIADLNRRIDVANGKAPTRRLVVSGGKGL
jgi:hypothetical protein